MEIRPEDEEAYVRGARRGRFRRDDALAALRDSQTPPQLNNDPALTNAARQVSTARRNARDAGQTLAPEDQEAFFRETAGGQFGLRGPARYLSTRC